MKSIRLDAKALLVCCFLLLLLAVATPAQQSKAKVQGLVTDSSHAVIAGAEIVLTNDETGVSTRRASNSTGFYFFQSVEPGRYTVTVHSAGFHKQVLENVLVQVAGDVTVNAELVVGSTTESLTITAAAPGVEFNSANLDHVISSKALSTLPSIGRNPVSLAMLDPTFQQAYGYTGSALLPFNELQNEAIAVAGNSQDNEFLLDGASSHIGFSNTYTPPMDSVAEFSVQQNVVDAEYGHSSGGTINIVMKSGTNQLHGSAYYYGLNPSLNARSSSTANSKAVLRDNIWGATAGDAIIKNKLFTFGTYEQWIQNQPQTSNLPMTLPVGAERNGDFSQSLTSAGAQRTIYDPLTTVLNTATNTSTRTPFAGNVIPVNRMDPTAVLMMKNIWAPNNPGINAAGTNNFNLIYSKHVRYWNFSDRADWNPTDKLRFSGRYSRYTSQRDPQNFGNSPASPISGYGTAARSYLGDVVYTLSPTTVLEGHLAYASIDDSSNTQSTQIGSDGLKNLWPNQWYSPYLGKNLYQFFPQLLMAGASGTTSLGTASVWEGEKHNHDASVRLSMQRGRHHIKVGLGMIPIWGASYNAPFTSFSFNAATTSSTFISPNTKLSGDPYATFLLGYMDGGSTANYSVHPSITLADYDGYLQDDIRISQRVTVNLGLRYEYETSQHESHGYLSKYLDMTQPNSAMQNFTVANMPAAVTQYGVKYNFNGVWHFTNGAGDTPYNTPKDTLLPRAGIAIRVNDKTALRFGYARYKTPLDLSTGATDSQNYLYGYSSSTGTQAQLAGIPQAVLSNPFPASTNPLIMPKGQELGGLQNLGGPAAWYSQNIAQGRNDRFNASVQKQLKWGFVVDGTLFLNLGANASAYTLNPQRTDPNLSLTYKSALSQTVANPFYHLAGMNGSLANQAQVSILSLLNPSPQYTSLSQLVSDGPHEHYKSMQIRVQRQFSRGFAFTASYLYNSEESQTTSFNVLDSYSQTFRWLPSGQPHHVLVAYGTYELPFGKGRGYLAHANSVLDAVVGGWTLSPVLTVKSGDTLQFGQLTTNCSAAPASYRNYTKWFDTSCFSQAAAFTVRDNPTHYDGVTGPRYWNMDLAFAKFFPIRERFKLEFRMDAFNLTNTFVGSDPSTNPTSASYGRITNQANAGRTIEYTGRIHF
jgi:hypothetical protein